VGNSQCKKGGADYLVPRITPQPTAGARCQTAIPKELSKARLKNRNLAGATANAPGAVGAHPSKWIIGAFIIIMVLRLLSGLFTHVNEHPQDTAIILSKDAAGREGLPQPESVSSRKDDDDDSGGWPPLVEVALPQRAANHKVEVMATTDIEQTTSPQNSLGLIGSMLNMLKR
jgi:hypothetical protein